VLIRIQIIITILDKKSSDIRNLNFPAHFWLKYTMLCRKKKKGYNSSLSILQITDSSIFKITQRLSGCTG